MYSLPSQAQISLSSAREVESQGRDTQETGSETYCSITSQVLLTWVHFPFCTTDFHPAFLRGGWQIGHSHLEGFVSLQMGVQAWKVKGKSLWDLI